MSTRDDGSATLTTVILTPVAIAVALTGFQLALWTHARTEARAIARDSAVLVARSGVSPSAAETSAERLLRDEVGLTAADVVFDPDTSTTVTVTVRGSAPGMFRWVERSFEVTEAVPTEGFRAP